jgi:hypothetical protein
MIEYLGLNWGLMTSFQRKKMVLLQHLNPWAGKRMCEYYLIRRGLIYTICGDVVYWFHEKHQVVGQVLLIRMRVVVEQVLTRTRVRLLQ